MSKELTTKINAAFWSKYHASFGQKQLENIVNFGSIYWLYFHGVVYSAIVSGDKVLSVGRHDG